MFALEDINTIESDDCTSPEQYYSSIQRAINSGMWGMQGSYGRAMMDAIEGGHCVLGTSRARDYYGNIIPSRDDVQDGTKGSFGYVEELHGRKWADFISSI